MSRIFGADFVEIYRTKRSAGYVDLMAAFEAKKRTANPTKVSGRRQGKEKDWGRGKIGAGDKIGLKQGTK